MPRLEEVFGISVTPVLSYVERPQVDGAFVNALAGPHHIVIYGASKQGKTALRQKYVAESQCVVYRCGLHSTPAAIYQSILRDSGIQIDQAISNTDSTKGVTKGSWSFKAIIPWVGGTTVSGEAAVEASKGTTKTMSFVDVEFGDAQMIGSLLTQAKFDRFVVLENFH